MGILDKQTVEEFWESQNDKKLLRFMTCGSVDDGKSTLIGRLLFESNNIFEDQIKTLEQDSRHYGTQGQETDLALLVDGLQAEREQGITIDVAYRFFSTDKRRFIVADTPGHEQYTRNMATAASTADLGLVLIDARKGVLPQTCRHTRILAMMGVRHLALVINKMDLVDFSDKRYQQIETDYRRFLAQFDFKSLHIIPVAAIDGDNILVLSPRMAWYRGPALMQYLETIDVQPDDKRLTRFRMPVQMVSRPSPDFRGYRGTIIEGKARVGDRVRVVPAGPETHIKTIWQGFNAVDIAECGTAVTLTLADEIDISRGDILVAADTDTLVADQFTAKILWMNQKPLVPGRHYIMKLHCKEVTATVTAIKHREDIETGSLLAAKSLEMNDIAVVNLSIHQAVTFEPYSVNKTLGGFILIDKLTYETAGAGMIEYALRRSTNTFWQALEVGKLSRAAQKKQTPRCLWFTGLSGAGKSTIANLLEKRLHTEGIHTYVLDGDNLRHGLNRDLGFTEADRVENVRRTAEVARLMVDAGLVVLVSLISPFRTERDMARSLFENSEFIEVFVDASLQECERRDAKGLYKKARRGEIKNFTGIDSLYEAPQSPEIHLHTEKTNPDDSVDRIMLFLANLHTLKS